MELNTNPHTEYKPTLINRLARMLDWRFVLLGMMALGASHAVMFDSIAPFGMAMLGACLSKRRWSTYVLIMHITGTILITVTGINILAYITGGIILLLLMQLYDNMPPVIATTLTLTATKLPRILLVSDGMYEMGMLIIEVGIVALTLPLLLRFVNLLMYPSRKKHTDSNDLLAVFAMMCITVISAGEVSLAYEVSLASLISGYLIMLVSMAGGFSFGGATGAILGIASGLYTVPDLRVVGIYSVCGLVCGAVKHLGRWGIIAGFILTSGLFIVTAPLQAPVGFTIPEQIIASALLLITSKKTLFFLENTFNACFPEPAYATRIKGTVTDRLVSVSVALDKLSGYMKKISSAREQVPSEDIFTVFDRAANKVCHNCLMSVNCWQKEYDITAAALMDSSSFLSEMGYIEVDNLPSHFRNKCKKVDKFTEEVNNEYNSYNIQRVLHRKISVGEDMAARQIKDFSKIINGLNSSLTREITFDTQLEKRLTDALSTLPIAIYELNAVINHKGRYDIRVTVPDKSVITPLDICSIISQTMEKGMQLTSSAHSHNRLTLHYGECTPYALEWGIAASPMDGEDVCGDSSSVAEISDGRVIMALSDGMGSGATAAGQSDATIQLLSKFFEAGFGAESTLQMINSILLLRSGAESFATVDLVTVDKYTGECEFIKIGANCSYILTDDSVQQISSKSLPAGILTEVDAERTSLRPRTGSYIIILSDGIESANDLWVADYIRHLPPCPPKELADHILKAAIERCGGCDDDMTVIAAHFTKGDVTYA